MCAVKSLRHAENENATQTCADTLPNTQMWLSIFAAAKLKPNTEMRMGVIIAPPPIPATEEKTLTKNTRKLPETSLLVLPVNKEDLKQRVEDEAGQDAHWHADEHWDSIKDALQTGAARASIGQITLGVARSDAEDLQTQARSRRDNSRAGGAGGRVQGTWESTCGATEPSMSARVCACM